MFFVQATENLQSSPLSTNLLRVDTRLGFMANHHMCFLEALFFLFCMKAVMRLSQFNRNLKRNISCLSRQVYTLKKKNKQTTGDYMSSVAAFLYLMLSSIFFFFRMNTIIC